MAAGDYLKTAASSLRNAVASLQQQAKEMQGNFARLKSDKTTVINKTQLEIKSRQVESDAVNDNQRRSRLAREIQKMQDEIIAAEQVIKKAEADVQNAVKAKLDSAVAIENQAKDLEGKAGSID